MQHQVLYAELYVSNPLLVAEIESSAGRGDASQCPGHLRCPSTGCCGGAGVLLFSWKRRIDHGDESSIAERLDHSAAFCFILYLDFLLLIALAAFQINDVLAILEK